MTGLEEYIKKQILKIKINKHVFAVINMSFFVTSLAVPWFNSRIYTILMDIDKMGILASVSICIGYFVLIGIMKNANIITPNDDSFKEKVLKEFISYPKLFKSLAIYFVSIVFLSSNNQGLGLALLIPNYMFLINFYTSISSGEIQKGWF